VSLNVRLAARIESGLSLRLLLILTPQMQLGRQLLNWDIGPKVLVLSVVFTQALTMVSRKDVDILLNFFRLTRPARDDAWYAARLSTLPVVVDGGFLYDSNGFDLWRGILWGTFCRLGGNTSGKLSKNVSHLNGCYSDTSPRYSNSVTFSKTSSQTNMSFYSYGAHSDAFTEHHSCSQPVFGVLQLYPVVRQPLYRKRREGGCLGD